MKWLSPLISSLFISVLFATFSLKVNALSPLSTEELSTLCDDTELTLTDPESAQCIRYIKGFIDGLLMAQKHVQTIEDKKRSSFVERAIETRIGSRIENREPLTAETQLCWDDNPVINDVVENISQQIRKNQDADISTLTRVYQAIKQSYPCEYPAS
ncbi:Rap1a/Tai family immunity protein [Aliikangiella maris]|uniref:Rap1a/Tai family immunity protein n=2 Tax=Aliikangiella maris TaxID=3162458 RepID=A0ABV3MUL9_9GAMM